ncbi:MAG TPA: ABC transporter ATP-binding protein [Steroidobacteraceae bacterium]
MSELALRDVRLSAGEREILKGITLTVPRGTAVALVGPAGSGKTSLLRAVAGLAEPQEGRICIGEKTIFDAAKGHALPSQKRGIGYAFPSDSLLQQRTVFENLAFSARYGAFGAEDIRQRVHRALEQVGALELATRLPPQLSIPERGRVALARALLRSPPVLLLDDPLGTLEGTARSEARGWLRQLIADVGACTLIATRDPVEAMAIADHVVVINDGAIEQEGPPLEVYNEPATVFTAEYMAQSNRLPGTLIENAGTRACIDVMGCQIAGITQTRAPLGSQALGLIRVERTRIGGGPGPNRLPMTIATQMYIGERWEVVFRRGDLTVHAYMSAPLRHESYHVEFPTDALWVF